MENMSFEEALGKLEDLVEKLESGELNLEASIEAFEEGIKLSLLCQKELQKADGKIQRLIESLNGEIVLSDIEELI